MWLPHIMLGQTLYCASFLEVVFMCLAIMLSGFGGRGGGGGGGEGADSDGVSFQQQQHILQQ